MRLPMKAYRSARSAADHPGWFANFAGLDCPASSPQTQQQLGWRPTQSALIPDIDRPIHFETRQETSK